jgi:hypothetical protein
LRVFSFKATVKACQSIHLLVFGKQLFREMMTELKMLLTTVGGGKTSGHGTFEKNIYRK